MKIKLSESKLRQIVTESVKKILSEDFNNNGWGEFVKSQRKIYEELLNFLQRQGIESAVVGEFQSGAPCIKISTNEYNKKNVWEIANKFAESRKMYISDDSYPATTYLSLNSF